MILSVNQFVAMGLDYVYSPRKANSAEPAEIAEIAEPIEVAELNSKLLGKCSELTNGKRHETNE